MCIKMASLFPTPHHHCHVTITNFSRWNNANAEPFNRRLRTQKLIEDDLRRARRFHSADRIAESHSHSSASPFRSLGTPSDPSRRSIPGTKSKYSKYAPSLFREREVRVGVGDDDVATKASEYSGNVNYPSGNSTFGDDDVAIKTEVAEEVREGGDDVAMKAFRDSGNGVDDDWDGNSENVEFSSTLVRRFDDSVEEGGDAYVAVKESKFSENTTFRRFRGSDGEIKQGWDGDMAAKGSKYSGNVKTMHPASRRFRDKEGREGGADVAVKAYRNSGDEKPSHPAFRRFKDSVRGASMTVKSSKYAGNDKHSNVAEEGVRVCEDGVSYVVGGAPFEFMYSYTETPKVKPVRLREPPVAPFGPTTMARPWTGRKPLAKKKLPEFDSFKLPPPHKKGVKPVQSPGPFLPGSGPKYVHSREEILGEPLTKAEIEEVVNGCRKSRRQMHMGRDGLTHNMLENIHAHWKRRRVCKIKCLGVCTVDMDNVRQQLEDKTGGKVIYGSGGVIYLFRGRNYNYMTRPRYPLMLWKPITPVYPRLVQRVPDGLTIEEASEMRKKGRNLIPICKLGKNGVYSNLVRDVREAFEACDLVRINCQGMSSSDYHKIGAKLKDLVPCVLISFEREHILMWRGKQWTSSLPELGETPKIENSEYDVTLSSTSDSEDEGISTSFSSDSEDEGKSTSVTEKDSSTSSLVSDSFLRTDGINGNEILNTVDDYTRDDIKLSSLWAKGVRLLLKEAIDNGAAIILDNSSLDSDIVFQTALGLAKSAPPGPVFKDRRRKVVVQKPEKPKTEDLKVEEVLMTVQDNNRESAKKSSYKRELVMEGVESEYIDVVPPGSLRVDELAKLLA